MIHPLALERPSFSIISSDDLNNMVATIRVRIPTERVGSLIGQNGAVKRKIEMSCGVKLDIDSKSGEVELISSDQNADPVSILKAQTIVSAIGRGFAPTKALRLVEDDILLHVLDLRDYVAKSRENTERIRGRLIGRSGRTRQILEETTDASVSIYGHTVSLIGGHREVELAKDAIERLIGGSEHRTVYRHLSRMRQELKKDRMKIWEDHDTG
ncbi:MAG: KH domain-containing protein [Candidatus Bathyarchaeia archaeon]